jgi:homocysteine S-methyltransferase
LPGLIHAGLSARETGSLFERAFGLARAAIAGAALDPRRARPVVAASLGPFGAYLANGSEYRGDYAVGERSLYLFHRPRLRMLRDAGARLFALETIPSALEARALLTLLDEHDDTWAWLSLQCRDSLRLADGTPLEELVPELRHPRLIGIGVNCVPPSLVAPLLRTLGPLTELPLVAYPHSGGVFARGVWSGPGSDWSEDAPVWLDTGARLIGGCCRTGPEDIARLRCRLDAVGPR